MKKRLIFLIILTIITLGILKIKISKAKQFSITIEGKSINYVTREDRYQPKASLFRFAFDTDNSEYLHSVDIGDKVCIDFGEHDIDKLVIKDHMLDNNGRIIKEDMIQGVPITCDNGKHYFSIEEDVITYIMSKYKLEAPKQEKRLYRGFAIITTIGDIEKVYMFAIKTRE